MRFRVFTLIAILGLAILLASGCNLADRLGGEVAPGDTAGQEPTPAESRTGTVIITLRTDPAGQAGSFHITGVPTGTIPAGGTLVASNLAPGTYTATEINPAPGFDVTAVECDDGGDNSSRGDPQTRTAIFNLDPGETVNCLFTNTRRGLLVITNHTEPEGAGGSFRFTGVPTGTIVANGTLVVGNLTPGTYSSTEVDPAPAFDLAAIDCNDGASENSSSGDPQTRTAIFNLDPGEIVNCTFTNIQRGTVVVASQTVPEDAGGSFQFTGVPSGTIPAGGSLVVSNLQPGTYTTTEVDPTPDFDLTAIECSDGASENGSLGDASSRTAIYNLDAGETVTCTFTNEKPTAAISHTLTAGGNSGEPASGSSPGEEGADPGGGTNPFENPDSEMVNFPLPEELPPGAGTFKSPKPGPWSVTHFPGIINCNSNNLSIPASPAESGMLELLDGGQTIIGTGLGEGASITLYANPEINGRYQGSFQGQEQGVPVTINYYWQVVTDEYIVGYMTAAVTAQGVNCSVYRSFEMVYTG